MTKSPYQIFLGNPQFRQLARDYLFTKSLRKTRLATVWKSRNKLEYGPISDYAFIHSSILSGNSLGEKNRIYFGLMSRTMGELWRELPHAQMIPFFAKSRLSRIISNIHGDNYRMKYYSLHLSDREDIGLLIGKNGRNLKGIARKMRDWTGEWPFIVYHRDRSGRGMFIIETMYHNTGRLTLEELSKMLRFVNIRR